jgi:hypothetical protein
VTGAAQAKNENIRMMIYRLKSLHNRQQQDSPVAKKILYAAAKPFCKVRFKINPSKERHHADA